MNIGFNHSTTSKQRYTAKYGKQHGNEIMNPTSVHVKYELYKEWET